MKKNIITLIAFFMCAVSYSQTPFLVYDSIDINNFNAAAFVQGTLWEKPDYFHSHPYPYIYPKTGAEFPKHAGASPVFAGALWITGFDNTGQLHTSTQEYLLSTTDTSFDYWPGPLDSITHASASYSDCSKWAKIWKIYQTQIDSFLHLGYNTLFTMPKPILQWPAKGNPYATGNGGATLTITSDMAPFVDVDHDGKYDPTKGDYPKIKGEEALWWVYNDNGPTHTHAKAPGLGFEIHVMAYAYRRWSMIDNVVYYDYKLINRSINNYTNLRVGQWADPDLGYGFDDYIGCDTNRRLGIIYNGDDFDGDGSPGTYALGMPMAGITMVHQPGDIGCNTRAPLGDFIYYNNDYTAIGNPANGMEYYYYLNAQLRDGRHFKNDWNGIPASKSKAYGSGADVNYVFTGDVKDTTQWSECNSANLPYDRRMVMATSDFDLPAGASENLVIALLAYPKQYGCPNTSFDTIKMVCDTAWYYYCNPPATLPLGVTAPTAAQTNFKLYPNPAHDIINIETQVNGAETSHVYDILGREMITPSLRKGNSLQLDIHALPPGAYTLLYTNGTMRQNELFIKQ